MKYYLIVFLLFFSISCSKDIVDEENTSGFTVLTYDAKISETLNLDIENIFLDETKELNYWAQYFQNPKNNLNHIFTTASFKKKDKIISGSRGPINITQPIYFNNNICHVLSKGFIECYDTSNDEVIFKIDVKHQGVNKFEIIRGGISYFDNKIVYADAYGQIS